MICNKLLLTCFSEITYGDDKYGYEYNKVMISNLQCIGNETDISVCPSDYWDTGNKNCSPGYYHSVGINCCKYDKIWKIVKKVILFLVMKK